MQPASEFNGQRFKTTNSHTGFSRIAIDRPGARLFIKVARQVSNADYYFGTAVTGTAEGYQFSRGVDSGR